MKYIAIAAGVLILLLGVACWLLYERTETLAKRTGVLETSNKQLQAAINAKTQATQGRAQVDQRVRQMAPAEVMKGLE